MNKYDIRAQIAMNLGEGIGNYFKNSAIKEQVGTILKDSGILQMKPADALSEDAMMKFNNAIAKLDMIQSPIAQQESEHLKEAFGMSFKLGKEQMKAKELSIAAEYLSDSKEKSLRNMPIAAEDAKSKALEHIFNANPELKTEGLVKQLMGDPQGEWIKGGNVEVSPTGEIDSKTGQLKKQPGSGYYAEELIDKNDPKQRILSGGKKQEMGGGRNLSIEIDKTQGKFDKAKERAQKIKEMKTVYDNFITTKEEEGVITQYIRKGAELLELDTGTMGMALKSSKKYDIEVQNYIKDMAIYYKEGTGIAKDLPQTESMHDVLVSYLNDNGYKVEDDRVWIVDKNGKLHTVPLEQLSEVFLKGFNLYKNETVNEKK